jgi:hypothetical protein
VHVHTTTTCRIGTGPDGYSILCHLILTTNQCACGQPRKTMFHTPTQYTGTETDTVHGGMLLGRRVDTAEALHSGVHGSLEGPTCALARARAGTGAAALPCLHGHNLSSPKGAGTHATSGLQRQPRSPLAVPNRES